LWPKLCLVRIVPTHSSGLTEICDVTFPAHASHAVQVRLKSDSNEGHFILEAERVFHPFLPWHCSGVTEIYEMEPPVQVIEAVQVRLKSVYNEGLFILKAETV
jgi:hypothetical protein